MLVQALSLLSLVLLISQLSKQTVGKLHRLAFKVVILCTLLPIIVLYTAATATNHCPLHCGQAK